MYLWMYQPVARLDYSNLVRRAGLTAWDRLAPMKEGGHKTPQARMKGGSEELWV